MPKLQDAGISFYPRLGSFGMDTLPDVFCKVAAQMREADGLRFLISHEGITWRGWYPVVAEAFCACFSDFDIRVVAMTTDPVRFAEKCYRQVMIHNRVNTDLPENYVNRFITRGHFDYSSLSEGWGNQSNVKDLVIINYDSSLDIISDFEEFLGFKLPRQERKNTTFNSAACRLSRCLKELGYPTRRRHKVLSEQKQDLDALPDEPFIGETLREKILQAYRPILS